MLDEIEALVRAAGGRTLGLFFSTRAAQSAAEQLRARFASDKTPIPILCQGEDQISTLVRQFARDGPPLGRSRCGKGSTCRVRRAGSSSSTGSVPRPDGRWRPPARRRSPGWVGTGSWPCPHARGPAARAGLRTASPAGPATAGSSPSSTRGWSTLSTPASSSIRYPLLADNSASSCSRPAMRNWTRWPRRRCRSTTRPYAGWSARWRVRPWARTRSNPASTTGRWPALPVPPSPSRWATPGRRPGTRRSATRPAARIDMADVVDLVGSGRCDPSAAGLLGLSLAESDEALF